MNLIADKKLSFISRSSLTFSITETLKERAWDINEWEDLPSYSTSKEPTVYGCQKFVEQVEGRGYRFIVIKSSHLEARKEKTITKNLVKERKKLEHLAKELLKQELACEADANATLVNFLEKNKKVMHEIIGTVEVVTKRKRSRPAI